MKNLTWNLKMFWLKRKAIRKYLPFFFILERYKKHYFIYIYYRRDGLKNKRYKLI